MGQGYLGSKTDDSEKVCLTGQGSWYRDVRSTGVWAREWKSCWTLVLWRDEPTDTIIW